jgi:hypothetical protein
MRSIKIEIQHVYYDCHKILDKLTYHRVIYKTEHNTFWKLNSLEERIRRHIVIKLNVDIHS